MHLYILQISKAIYIYVWLSSHTYAQKKDL